MYGQALVKKGKIMIIKEMPLSERPREKLIADGPGSLSNRELLAILIGSGTRERTALSIADELLCMDSRGLKSLSECTVSDLSGVKGIGTAKACVLVSAIELGKRISSGSVYEEKKISAVGDVVDVFMEKMRYLKKEYFNALLLNSKGGIICEETVSIGDLHTSIVHPREAFQAAVNRGAAAVVFVHNHPSGDPTPSSEDINVTKRLIMAGNVMGISVFDHIIIGDGTYVSLNEKGYIE